MRSCRPLLGSFLVLWLVFFATSSPAQDLPLPEKIGPELVRAEEQRIGRSLSEVADWDFVDTPIKDVIDSIAKRLNCNSLIDIGALEDIGFGIDTPITIRLKGITYRSCLNLFLREHSLSWRVDEGLLFISTIEEMEAALATRAFPVGELVGGAQRSNSDDVYSSLVGAIVDCLEADSWDSVGGSGSIQGIYGSLVVSQTREVHEQIAQLLDACRAIIRQLEEDPAAVPKPRGLFEANTSRIDESLAKPTRVDFHSVALRETLGYLASMHDIPIVTDTQAWEDFGIGSDTPITFRLSGLPLSSCLTLMLRPLGLTYVLQDQVLMVTTVEAAESLLQVKLYPVNDLVELGPQSFVIEPGSGLFGDFYPGRKGGDRAPAEFDDLFKAIQSTIQPDSWDVLGGPASMASLQRPIVLVVAQTERAHRQIERLLGELRQAKQQVEKGLAGEAGGKTAR